MGFDAGDANLFRYCGGDPVNGSDPFGLDRDHDLHDPDIPTTGPVNVDGKSVNEPPEPWSVFGPLNDYLNTLFADDKSRVASDPGDRSNSNAQQRDQPGVPDYAIREVSRAYPLRDGKIYWAMIFWRIQLFHHTHGKHLGSGIEVREHVEFKDTVGLTAKEKELGHHPTREDGSVEDHYFLSFDTPDGKATVIQTIFAGGREATWEVIVHATNPPGEDSILEAPGQYAPFH